MTGSGVSNGGVGGAVNASPFQQWLIGVQALLQRHGLQARKWLTLSFLVTVWYYFSYEYNTRLKVWLSATQPGYQQAHGGSSGSLAPAQGAASSTLAALASSSQPGTDMSALTAAMSAAEAEYQKQHDLAVEASWLSPVTLPLLLAIFATTTCATLPWVLHASAMSPQLLPAWRRLWTHHTLDMALMCASTVFGTAAITVVYEYGSIQLVQVARSIGPLFTTGWAVLLLDQFTHGKPLLCLLATLGGTMLASWKEPTMCVMTLVLMIAANTCMTFRNVITRRLLTVLGMGHGHGKAEPPPPQQQQQQQAQQVEEQPPKGVAVALARSPTLGGAGSEPDYSSIPPTHMASLLLTTGNATGVVVLVTTLVLASYFDPKAASLVTEITPAATRQLMILGGTNWAYNLASQLVLAQLTVVAHGMLELLKRVFVLVAVSIFAQKAHWQWHNVMGACITFLAAALYFHYSHQQKHAAALKAHRSENLEASSPFSISAGSQIRLGSTSGFMRLIKSFVRKQQLALSGASSSSQQQQQDHMAEPDQDAARKAGGRQHHLQGSPDDDEECVVTLKAVHGEQNGSSTTTTDGQPVKVIASSASSNGHSHSHAGTSSGGGYQMDAAAVVHIKQHAAGGTGGHTKEIIEMTASADNMHHRATGKQHGGSNGTAFVAYSGAQPYGDRSPPHRSNHGSVDCATACLPPSGPPRLNVARAIVITIMLFTVPLLVPLGSWPYILGTQTRPAMLAGYRLYQLPGATGLLPAGSAGFPALSASSGGSITTTTTTTGAGDADAPTSTSPADGGRADLPVDEGHGGDAAADDGVHDLGAAASAPDAAATTVTTGSADGAGGDGDTPLHRRLLRQQRASAALMAAWWSGGSGSSNRRSRSRSSSRRSLKHMLFGEDLENGDSNDMAVQLIPVGTVSEQQGGVRTMAASTSTPSSSIAPRTSNVPKRLYGFYVGWLGHANLGDEIVADIFYDLLKDVVKERVPAGAVVDMPKELDQTLDRRFPGCGDRGHHLCHFAVLGGGSTVDAAFVMAASDMLRAKKPVLLFGSGYQRVHHNPKIQAESLAMLMNGDVMGGIRGYVTEEFLLVRTNRTLPVIGDSGFLSDALYPGSGLSLPEVPNLPAKIPIGQPIPNWPPPQECIEASRSGRGGGPDEAPGGKCQRPLVVVTLRSELTNYDLSKDSKALSDVEDIDSMRVPRHPIAVMMLVIAELVNEHHFQVVLQDVDDKSLAVHQRYLGIINKRILPGNPPVVLHKSHDNYNHVMDLYERASVSLNCRLHSGVLAASALRPIVYMASLPKFADFMSSIGQENYLVNPELGDLKVAGTADLAKLMVSKVLQAAQDAAGISASLARVRDAMLSKYKQAVRDMLDRMGRDNPDQYREAITQCPSVKITRSYCVTERTIVNIECTQ